MIKNCLPNFVTSMNLAFGMFSILFSIEGRLGAAVLAIFLALIADGLDGRIARALNSTSEMGKEMDSLCDLGSFGIAPAVLAWQLCLKDFGELGALSASVFALCGMNRLARFNVNTSTVHGYFMGLAIPAAGCLVAATTVLFLALGVNPAEYGYVYPVGMLVVSYLMVSHVHYPDFKSDGDKLHTAAKIASAVVFLAIVYAGRDAMGYAVLTAIFGAYAVFGIVNSLFLVSNKGQD